MCDMCEHGAEKESCYNCGCPVCYDVKKGNAVTRPACVTPSGDLYCDRCWPGPKTNRYRARKAVRDELPK